MLPASCHCHINNDKKHLFKYFYSIVLQQMNFMVSHWLFEILSCFEPPVVWACLTKAPFVDSSRKR